MSKKLLLGLALLLTLASCGHRQQPTGITPLNLVASYPLGAAAELHLLSDGNLSQLELYYSGELQELIATANTDYLRTEAGQIALDTVHLDGDTTTQYIVRTFDRSSTYGAEVWYLVHPYRTGDPDGPWCLLKVPGDMPTLQDIPRLIVHP